MARQVGNALLVMERVDSTGFEETLEHPDRAYRLGKRAAARCMRLKPGGKPRQQPKSQQRVQPSVADQTRGPRADSFLTRNSTDHRTSKYHFKRHFQQQGQPTCHREQPGNCQAEQQADQNDAATFRVHKRYIETTNVTVTFPALNPHKVGPDSYAYDKSQVRKAEAEAVAKRHVADTEIEQRPAAQPPRFRVAT